MAHATASVNPPLRVVLVEPSNGDARWFEIVLSPAGIPYELTRYTSGVAALDNLSRDVPATLIDFVATDWLLPVLLLKDFVSQLRSKGGFERVPVVVFADDDYQIAEARKVGAVACLAKPVDAMQLHAVIDAAQVLGKRNDALVRASS